MDAWYRPARARASAYSKLYWSRKGWSAVRNSDASSTALRIDFTEASVSPRELAMSPRRNATAGRRSGLCCITSLSARSSSRAASFTRAVSRTSSRASPSNPSASRSGRSSEFADTVARQRLSRARVASTPTSDFPRSSSASAANAGASVVNAMRPAARAAPRTSPSRRIARASMSTGDGPGRASDSKQPCGSGSCATHSAS